MVTRIQINKESIEPSKICGGTTGSYGFRKIAFSFGAEWKGLGKRIVFSLPRSAPVAITITDETAEYDIPAEVTSCTGDVPFYVQGMLDNEVIYTVSGVVEMLPTSLSKRAREPMTPTPDEVAQIYTYMMRYNGLLEEITANLENTGYLYYSLASVGIADGQSVATANVLNAMPLKSALFARIGENTSTLTEIPLKSGTLYLIKHESESEASGFFISDSGTLSRYGNGEWLEISSGGGGGQSAGFGTPTAEATSLPEGSSPTVSVSASGDDTEKVFSFTFGIPKGDKGEQGIQGPQGIQGVQGIQGDKGDKGDTPQKGVDYYTEADKTEMVNSVLAALPTWEGGSY